MHAASAAEALSLDPVRQRRKKIFEEINVLIARRLTGRLSIEELAEYDKILRNHGGAGTGIREWDVYKPRPAKFYKIPHSRTQWRKRIIADLARDYGTTERTVEQCLRDFDLTDRIVPYQPPPKHQPALLPGWTLLKLRAWQRKHGFPKSVYPRELTGADYVGEADWDGPWRAAFASHARVVGGVGPELSAQHWKAHEAMRMGSGWVWQGSDKDDYRLKRIEDVPEDPNKTGTS
jgi:hypothetical protein